MILFETERLRVRLYTADDEDYFFRMNGDEEIVRYIRPAKSREDCKLFLEEVIAYSIANPSYGRWAVEEKATGVFVGSFAIIPVTNTSNMQLGYALLKEQWGKGYATELTRAGLVYTFSQTALPEIYAITESANLPSQQVLLKAGFTEYLRYTEGEKDLIQYIFKKENGEWKMENGEWGEW